MKKFKTLSATLLTTTLLGFGVIPFVGATPVTNADAKPAKQLTVGKDETADDITVNPDDFNPDNATPDSRRASSITPFDKPTYDSSSHKWRLAQGKNTDNGSATVAFNRPFDLSKDFNFEAQLELHSSDDMSFNSDFMGVILTTDNPDHMAKNQVVAFHKNAGYANENTKWQSVFGVYADMGGDTTHQNVVRTSQNGVQSNQLINQFETGPTWAGWFAKKVINQTYDVHYKHSDDGQPGVITFSVPKQSKTVSLQLPDHVSHLYIGAVTTNAGNGDLDDGGINFSNFSGSYATTKTDVNYVNENVDPGSSNYSLGKKSVITSIIGEHLSVSGNDVGANGQNYIAPHIEHATLNNSAAERANRTIVTKELADDSSTPNIINVKYDAAVENLPYKVVDDTQKDSPVIKNGMAVKSKTGNDQNYAYGDSYDYDTTNVIDHVELPKGVDVKSLENPSGTINDNNTPIIIHVEHHMDYPTLNFTRKVHYVFDDGLTGTPAAPADAIDPYQVKETIDEYLKNNDASYKPTFDLKNFKDIKSPEVEGYVPNQASVNYSQETIDEKTQLFESTTVKYGGTLQLYAPAIDFGTVHYGDRVFDGAAQQGAANLKGDLDIANTDPAKKDVKWHVKVNMDDNFMIGSPTLTIFGKELNGTKQTDLFDYTRVNDTLLVQKGIYRIVDSSKYNGHPDALKQLFSLKFNGLRNQHIDWNSGDKDYSGTITWTIGTGPA